MFREYDLNGNIISSKNQRGMTTTYSYDQVDRIISATYSGGKSNTITYGYGSDNNEKVTYFDALGRIVKEVNEGITSDNSKMTTQYEYYIDGNLKKLTKNDGTVEEYLYDNRGRLTTLKNDANNYTTYEYDNNGNRKKMIDVSSGQSIISSYSYDSMDRMTQMIQDGHTINYQYDGSDNIIKVHYPSEEGNMQKDIEYKYDTYNRLQKILVEGKAVTKYTYTNYDEAKTTNKSYNYDEIER